MEPPARLYLFTLEVTPLEVGSVYNPLPSHLTLISRFYTSATPEHIADNVNHLFASTKPLALVFDGSAMIGPKHTAVHLIQQSAELKRLHVQLADILSRIGVDYTQPDYIRQGWKPHVSRREADGFMPGNTHITTAAYLIEVDKQGDSHLRTIRKKYSLAGE